MKRLEWRAGIAFSLLLALLLGNAFLANRALQGLADAHEKVGHTWEVRVTLRDTQTHFERSLAAIRGYFYLGDPSMLDVWKTSRREMESAFDRLAFLTGDNPRQQKRLRDVRKTLAAQSKSIEGNIRLKAKIGRRWKPDPAELDASKSNIVAVRAIQNEMDAEERRLSIGRNGQARSDEREARLTIFGATAAACLALVATFALIRQMLQERLTAERAIRRANAELERRVAERTESLQTANRELEAFSYTVSHDLRAPLRHVAGFADLLEKKSGALLDEPGQRYLTLVQDAGRRAGTLVDDLLAFSRTSRAELGQSLISMVFFNFRKF